MWHVIELFQTHEELLVAELTREVGEMSPEFSAFLATLDNQIAGHESRPVNVGAICAETRDEWGGLEEQAKRRCAHLQLEPVTGSDDRKRNFQRRANGIRPLPPHRVWPLNGKGSHGPCAHPFVVV